VEPLHPTETPPDIKSFHEWDLGDEIQAAIEKMEITEPTPIQALAIGPVLEGKDVIAKAETGTGKTLAFGAPIMARIDPDRATVLALVLSPTRELAEQVATVMAELGEPRGLSVALVVGGEPLGPQVEAIQNGAQVIVATPGRVLDVYGQGFLKFPWTEYVVLDEADKMLEIGFLDDVNKILEKTPEERQTLLFSATFDTALLRLARSQTKDPAEIATASGVATVDTITQTHMCLPEEDRVLALIRLVERSAEEEVFLVFCDRRVDVDKLLRRMERETFSVKALHGGYDQAARFRVMSAFREKTVKVLLATDVASRGLDVKHVSHVINYDVPRDVMDYTHRIGRTGRAGREGRAITFVTPAKNRYWRFVESQATWEIPQEDAPGAGGGRDGGRRPRGRDDGSGRRGGERGGERGKRDGERGGRGKRDGERGKRGGARRAGSRKSDSDGRERSSRSSRGGGGGKPRRGDRKSQQHNAQGGRRPDSSEVQPPRKSGGFGSGVD
jgi:superfamily II DNA/RNA helicase